MQLSRGSMREQPSKAVGLVAGDDFSCATAGNDEPFCVPSNVNIATIKSKNASMIRLLIISSWLKNEVGAHHQAFSFSCLPFFCLPFFCLTLFPRSRILRRRRADRTEKWRTGKWEPRILCMLYCLLHDPKSSGHYSYGDQ